MENKSTMWIAVVVALVIGALGGYMIGANKSKSMMADDQKMMNEESADSMSQDTSSSEGVMVGGAMMTPDKDIVDNAMNANNVTTVVTAVKAAGLVDTLKGEGPFTVFAPNNAAFEKLPAGTVEKLLLPENKAMLANILTYHVVPGRYTSADLKDGMMLTTVQGQELKVSMKDGKWWINDSAMVETPDVISSNGVTFVIDTVLMPE